MMWLKASRLVLYPLLVGGFTQSALAAAPIIPPPPAIAASSYLLLDAKTQKVLVEQNLHEALPPASLTKIMTSFVAAAELKAPARSHTAGYRIPAGSGTAQGTKEQTGKSLDLHSTGYHLPGERFRDGVSSYG